MISKNFKIFKFKDIYIASGIALLCAALTLPLLGQYSIWYDESFSIFLASQEWSRFFDIIWKESEMNMSLYYIFLKIWIGFGKSEYVLRFPSAVFSSLSAVVIYFLVNILANRAAGIVAAFLYAFNNSFFIEYSTEARAYSLVMLLLSMSTFLLIIYIKKRSHIVLFAYTLISALACYAHFFSLIVILLQALVFLIYKGCRQFNVFMLFSYLSMGLMLSPLFYWIMKYSHSNLAWLSSPDFYDLVQLYTSMSGGSVWYLYSALFVYIIGFFTYLYDLYKNKDIENIVYYIFFILVLSLPIFLFLVSKHYSLFKERYFVVSYFCFPILLTISIQRLKYVYIKYFLYIFFLLFSFTTLVSGYGIKKPENWKEASAYILDNIHEKDGIVVYKGFSRLPLEYYFALYDKKSYDDYILGFDCSYKKYDENFKCYINSIDDVESIAKDYKRIWLVLSHDQTTNERKEYASYLKKILFNSYVHEKKIPFKGVRLYLYY